MISSKSKSCFEFVFTTPNKITRGVFRVFWVQVVMRPFLAEDLISSPGQGERMSLWLMRIEHAHPGWVTDTHTYTGGVNLQLHRQTDHKCSHMLQQKYRFNILTVIQYNTIVKSEYGKFPLAHIYIHFIFILYKMLGLCKCKPVSTDVCFSHTCTLYHTTAQSLSNSRPQTHIH